MNIGCSGVKTIFIDKILRTKLLRRLMTFLTVQLLFEKLSHTFLMLLFFRTYLTRNLLKHTVQNFKSAIIIPIPNRGPTLFNLFTFDLPDFEKSKTAL
jgi:hypothetical protein